MPRHRNLPISLFAIGLLAGGFIAPPAHADDASCKPVTDAMLKAAHTAYHEKMNAGGRSIEKIYTTTALYIGSNGHWMKMPMSPQDLIDAMQKSGATFTECKPLRTETVDGQPATVYAARERFPSIGEDDHSQVWIGNANGLPLKSETDTQRAGQKSHVSVQITYTNVQPPAGVH